MVRCILLTQHPSQTNYKTLVILVDQLSNDVGMCSSCIPCRNHVRSSTEVNVSGHVLVHWLLVLCQCRSSTYITRHSTDMHRDCIKNGVANLHMHSVFCEFRSLISNNQHLDSEMCRLWQIRQSLHHTYLFIDTQTQVCPMSVNSEH